ncbi:MAG: hypothetical protein ABII00_04530 [Elusimicrobiota bacterium]
MAGDARDLADSLGWALRPMAPARPRRARSRVHTALGSSWLPAWFLSALAPALERGLRVYWIDAGNRFDAYGLGRAARDLGADPRRALARVRLARPFNVFQLETILRRKLPAAWRGEPVVLSDPLAPFLDEDLPRAQVRRMLPRVLGCLGRLPALWMVLAVERKAPKERACVLDSLIRRSDRLLRLAEEEVPPRLRTMARIIGR